VAQLKVPVAGSIDATNSSGSHEPSNLTWITASSTENSTSSPTTAVVRPNPAV
jgi:hypothetical protein